MWAPGDQRVWHLGTREQWHPGTRAHGHLGARECGHPGTRQCEHMGAWEDWVLSFAGLEEKSRRGRVTMMDRPLLAPSSPS